jgi:glutamate dehydrogenase/leucine dehydrogenase
MNPFQNALAQLGRAAGLEKFNKSFLQFLNSPEREVRTNLFFKKDDGSFASVEGYRVQYNSLLGPYKGGIRFHPDTNLDEVKALSLWMMIKCAVASIPMGGGKGGATVDPKILSEKELENLSRAWARAFAPVLGPKKDAPGPDVNTNPKIMDWMVSEYNKVTGEKTKATFTGKSLKNGGSEGRGTATAQGGVYVLQALLKNLGLPKQLRVVVQGSGNAGLSIAKLLQALGHRIVAISDSKNGIYSEAGLDILAMEKFKLNSKSLNNFPDSKTITNKELLELDCDLLIPAALENQITKDNAGKIKAKVILELANGPTTPEADDILFSKNIIVIPDILANSGGVIVSTYEWEQNLKAQKWSEKKVFTKLKTKLGVEAKNVWASAKKYKTDMRRGAFILAMSRLETVFKKKYRVI